MNLLSRQHGQVLGHAVSKDRAKDADIEAAAIAHANHGLLPPPISNAQPRREILEAVLDVHRRVDATDAGYQDVPGCHVYEPARASRRYGLREINLPAQAIIKRQVRRNTPSILAIEEPPLLSLARVACSAHITLQLADVAEQEGSQWYSAVGAERAIRVLDALLGAFLIE